MNEQIKDYFKKVNEFWVLDGTIDRRLCPYNLKHLKFSPEVVRMIQTRAHFYSKIVYALNDADLYTKDIRSLIFDIQKKYEKLESSYELIPQKNLINDIIMKELEKEVSWEIYQRQTLLTSKELFKKALA